METQSNTAQAVTPRSVGIKFGLISALITIVLFLIQVLTGGDAFSNSFNWRSLAGLLVSVVIIALAHKNFKENGDGYMSYGQGVGIAFWASLISVLISLVVTVVYVQFIDPSLMDMFVQQQSEEMAAKGLSDDQIEMGVGIAKTVFWPMYLIMGVLFGVLIGVIVSIFTQKKNPQPAF